jgi:hypothetical protein
MKKRGQVTIFIIIGIVILIIAFIGIMFGEQITGGIGRLLSPEAEPLRLFIEQCAEVTGDKAVLLAASQGGYIVPPERLRLSYDGFLPPAPSPIQVPMWWYKGTSYVPTKEQIEQQISDYVTENLPVCLNDFNAFQQFDIINKGNLTVKTEMRSSDVGITVNYPMTVKPKKGNNTIELNKFSVASKRKLGQLYELASSIMEFENNNGFIENITMDIIAVANGAEDSPYFPFEGFDIRCGNSKQWSEQFQLIPDLQDMLHYNLNYVNVKGTNYVDSGYDYFRDQYSFRASNKDYPTTQVKIQYNKNWGMELNVQPSDGDTVKGFEIPMPIIGSCLTVYHHRYDIQYPIMIQLTDTDGTVFNFATPIVIEKNMPKRYVSPFVQTFEYSVSNSDYCADRTQERTIVVRDKLTGDSIPNVSLTYECVGFSCSLGKTDYPKFEGVPIYGASPSLTAKLPVCLNGIVSASAQGYKEATMQFTSGPGAGTPPAITMTPMKTLKIGARVLELSGDTMKIRPLSKDEGVAIFVRNEKEKFEGTFFYPSENFITKDFEIINGDLSYEFDAKLVSKDVVTGGVYIANWTVSSNTLSAANEIVINILTSPNPPKNLDEFSVLFKDLIVPKSEQYAPVIR